MQYFKVKEKDSAHNEKSLVPKTSSRKQLVELPRTNLTHDAAQHIQKNCKSTFWIGMQPQPPHF